MNCFKKLYCRSFQTIMKLAIPFMPYRKPEMIDSLDKIPKLLKSKNVASVLLVTDKGIRGLGLTKELENDITKASIKLTVFDDVIPNPTISNIEAGVEVYKQNNCEVIIAFGGGSVMDCAKIIGARIAKHNQPVKKMKGLLKICKKLPLLIAVPTTAGTGSETTLAAVITDDATHHKYPINDFNLIPHYAVLDYKTTIGLPPHITSTTGMDALTHAVEAYIGKSTTKQTREMAEKAVKLIVENIEKVYKNGKDKNARDNMLKASFFAGVAFTKSYVGYVHAVAHSLGGKYGVPHGLANAVILPYFLERYGQKVVKPLSKLAKIAGIADDCDDKKLAADKFVEWIKETNKKLNIPEYIDSIKKEDIAELAAKADSEANPLYPVPRLMDKAELADMYYVVGGIVK